MSINDIQDITTREAIRECACLIDQQAKQLNLTGQAYTDFVARVLQRVRQEVYGNIKVTNSELIV